MVSAEEALNFMEERAKKKKKTKPSSSLVLFPLSSPSGRGGKKRKQPELGSRPPKRFRKQRDEAYSSKASEPVCVPFPPKPSICSEPESFVQVFP